MDLLITGNLRIINLMEREFILIIKMWNSLEFGRMEICLTEPLNILMDKFMKEPSFTTDSDKIMES